MNIISTRVDYTIEMMHNKFRCGEICLPTSSLNGEDWSTEQKQAYIESVILGFPVSPYILTENDCLDLKVVDGVKRFKAVVGFLNDEFKVFPKITGSDSEFEYALFFSQLERRWQRKILRMCQSFLIHRFDSEYYATAFEERLHSDFEILGRKVIVIDRCLEFDDDSYLEGLILISNFNSYLMEKYPERNISIKIQQEGQKIRLIVETEDSLQVEVEHILNDFNKKILRQLNSNNTQPSDKFTINISNVMSNNINISFNGLLDKTNGLVNELIEELESEPELQNQLYKIIKSSNSVTDEHALKGSSFLSRAERFVEQAKEKGTKLYNVSKTSKECADLIRKISENIDSLSGMF
ncbi:hypothetical protein DZF89_24600 [Vibrio parahaemolyticus]|nr:hypothetical protein [Vibrio parahaemolyticus]MBE5191682.1 hypothetical protein [Vibrio parahaemolyticus]